jgi:hypothetical protein
MQFNRLSGILFLILMLCVVGLSCSKSKSPVEPGADSIVLPESDSTGNRDLIAVYDLTINPVEKTVELTPAERTTAFHFPVSNLLPNVLQITGFGWTPDFWADIKLVHPFPGSSIAGFDPRVIAILPTHAGAYFYYPDLGVYGNPDILLEPDGFTKLFDDLAPDIFGNVNPFIAYFKDQPYRRWSSTIATEETKRWQMNLDGFGGSLKFKLVVDVSTNYPSPATPIIDNAPEPVQIDATVGDGLTPAGGSADITVTLLDWQGNPGIGGVKVEAPDLFNGTVNLVYSEPGPDPYEYVYTGMISNEKLAPAGDYKYLLATWDQSTGIYLYSELSVSISWNNFQIEVTTTNSPQDFVCRFVNPGTLHVDWGDDSSNDYNATIDATHTYATAGVFTISMSGYVNGIDFFIYPDPGTGTPKLISKILTPIRGITGLNSATEMFKHCENIPSIPAGIFDQCPGITTFYDTFLACRKITSIPTDLFKYQTNVTNFYATFDNCDLITEIPPGLFDNHPNNTNFAWLFAKCYNLQSIPVGLFDDHAKNTTFSYTFFRCYDITSIPADLFEHNTQVTNFSNCFYECTGLTSIPPLLFDKNTKVTTYANCFYNCTNLTGPSPTNSAGLKLWELTPTPVGTGCFYNCTNLSDYASIPSGWK